MLELLVTPTPLALPPQRRVLTHPTSYNGLIHMTFLYTQPSSKVLSQCPDMEAQGFSRAQASPVTGSWSPSACSKTPAYWGWGAQQEMRGDREGPAPCLEPPLPPLVLFLAMSLVGKVFGASGTQENEASSPSPADMLHNWPLLSTTGQDSGMPGPVSDGLWVYGSLCILIYGVIWETAQRSQCY